MDCSEFAFTISFATFDIVAICATIIKAYCLIVDSTTDTGDRCQCSGKCRQEASRRLPLLKLAIFA